MAWEQAAKVESLTEAVGASRWTRSSSAPQGARPGSASTARDALTPDANSLLNLTPQPHAASSIARMSGAPGIAFGIAPCITPCGRNLNRRLPSGSSTHLLMTVKLRLCVASLVSTVWRRLLTSTPWRRASSAQALAFGSRARVAHHTGGG